MKLTPAEITAILAAGGVKKTKKKRTNEYVIWTGYDDDGKVIVGKDYHKVTKYDTGYYTTPARISSPRTFAGKARENPKFIAGNTSIIAYKKAPTT